MIHSVFASDPRFKTVTFRSGLNILLAERHEDATDTDTRNGVGKSSLINLLHFLMGANADGRSMFLTDALRDWTFGMTFDLVDETRTVKRSGTAASKVLTDLVVATASDDDEPEPLMLALDVGNPRAEDRPDGDEDADDGGGEPALEGDTFASDGDALHDSKSSDTGPPTPETLSVSNWLTVLRDRWFDLPEGDGPSARSLLSYFVRRVEGGGFETPFKTMYQQTPGDSQTAVCYLLGLDWQIAAAWEDVRRREKNVKALAKALRDGDLEPLAIGSVSKLRTQVRLAEKRVAELREAVANFRVVASFSDMEREANSLSRGIRKLSDANSIDLALQDQLRSTYEAETPPDAADVAAMYEAAGVQLGDVVRRRFEEVAEFHASIIANRAQHLASQIGRADDRIAERESEKVRMDVQRGELLRALQAGGALADLTALQERVATDQARLEHLRHAYETADALAAGKAGVKQARQELHVQLQQDQRERETQLGDLIGRFEEFSTRLYDERVGSLELGASENGPTFSVSIEAGTSKGISHMQVFCFDLLVAELCARRGIGPGFLVHDSHLFDGVDERQVGRGLALAEEVATTAGFQYIVTMNSDDIPTTVPDGFVLEKYVLDTVLTDALDDGGLFGFRFSGHETTDGE